MADIKFRNLYSFIQIMCLDVAKVFVHDSDILRSAWPRDNDVDVVEFCLLRGGGFRRAYIILALYFLDQPYWESYFQYLLLFIFFSFYYWGYVSTWSWRGSTTPSLHLFSNIGKRLRQLLVSTLGLKFSLHPPCRYWKSDFQ